MKIALLKFSALIQAIALLAIVGYLLLPAFFFFLSFYPLIAIVSAGMLCTLCLAFYNAYRCHRAALDTGGVKPARRYKATMNSFLVEAAKLLPLALIMLSLIFSLLLLVFVGMMLLAAGFFWRVTVFGTKKIGDYFSGKGFVVGMLNHLFWNGVFYTAIVFISLFLWGVSLSFPFLIACVTMFGVFSIMWVAFLNPDSKTVFDLAGSKLQKQEEEIFYLDITTDPLTKSSLRAALYFDDSPDNIGNSNNNNNTNTGDNYESDDNEIDYYTTV